MGAPPQPLPDPDSQPFWDGLAEGRLLIQYSPQADRWQFPPLERCRHSGGPLEWRQVSGRGRIFSFIVQHQAIVAGFADEVPYLIILVTLDDAPGVRLPSRLVGASTAAIGDAVQCEIVPLPGGDYHVPVFRLVDEA